MNEQLAFITLVVKDLNGIQEWHAEVGSSLFESLQKSGAAIASVCGGGGICGLCHVHLIGSGGQIPPLTDIEIAHLTDTPSFNAEVSRLACQISVSEQLDGVTVIPIET